MQRHPVLLRQPVWQRLRVSVRRLLLLHLEDDPVRTDAHLFTVVKELPAGSHAFRGHRAQRGQLVVDKAAALDPDTSLFCGDHAAGIVDTHVGILPATER